MSFVVMHKHNQNATEPANSLKSKVKNFLEMFGEPDSETYVDAETYAVKNSTNFSRFSNETFVYPSRLRWCWTSFFPDKLYC